MDGGRVGRGSVVAAVGVGEKCLRIVLHGVIVLLAAVVRICHRGVRARTIIDRRNPLVLWEHVASAVGVDIFLVILPGMPSLRQIAAQVGRCVLVSTVSAVGR